MIPPKTGIKTKRGGDPGTEVGKERGPRNPVNAARLIMDPHVHVYEHGR